MLAEVHLTDLPQVSGWCLGVLVTLGIQGLSPFLADGAFRSANNQIRLDEKSIDQAHAIAIIITMTTSLRRP